MVFSGWLRIARTVRCESGINESACESRLRHQITTVSEDPSVLKAKRVFRHATFKLAFVDFSLYSTLVVVETAF